MHIHKKKDTHHNYTEKETHHMHTFNTYPTAY